MVLNFAKKNINTHKSLKLCPTRIFICLIKRLLYYALHTIFLKWGENIYNIYQVSPHFSLLTCNISLTPQKNQQIYPVRTCSSELQRIVKKYVMFAMGSSQVMEIMVLVQSRIQHLLLVQIPAHRTTLTIANPNQDVAIFQEKKIHNVILDTSHIGWWILFEEFHKRKFFSSNIYCLCAVFFCKTVYFQLIFQLQYTEGVYF